MPPRQITFRRWAHSAAGGRNRRPSGRHFDWLADTTTRPRNQYDKTRRDYLVECCGEMGGEASSRIYRRHGRRGGRIELMASYKSEKFKDSGQAIRHVSRQGKIFHHERYLGEHRASSLVTPSRMSDTCI